MCVTTDRWTADWMGTDGMEERRDGRTMNGSGAGWMAGYLNGSGGGWMVG